MGKIEAVTRRELVAEKSDILLKEAIEEIKRDPSATDYQRMFPYRTAWLKCLDIMNAPDMRRVKSYRAHYAAVLEFMSKEWKEYL